MTDCGVLLLRTIWWVRRRGARTRAATTEKRARRGSITMSGKGAGAATRPVAFDHSVRGGVQTYPFPRMFPRCGTAPHQTLTVGCAKCKKNARPAQTDANIGSAVSPRHHSGSQGRLEICPLHTRGSQLQPWVHAGHSPQIVDYHRPSPKLHPPSNQPHQPASPSHNLHTLRHFTN